MALDFEEFSIFGRILLTFSHPVTRLVCLVVAGESRNGRGEGKGEGRGKGRGGGRGGEGEGRGRGGGGGLATHNLHSTS